MIILDVIQSLDYNYMFSRRIEPDGRYADGRNYYCYEIQILNRRTRESKIQQFRCTEDELPNRCAIIAGIIRDHTIDVMIGNI